MTATVTVLMSVHNGLPHLAEAIESILNQTYQDFQFLIFDDASRDGSNLVLKKYACQDDRIKIVTNQINRGLGYNLASGVEMANTPWIARMDADDLAIPNRLELQMAFVREHPDVDIVGGYALDIDDRDRVISERKVPISHDDICKLVWTNPFIHGTVLLRREAILQVGSYSSQLPKRQDYELWFRCVAAGLRFANLPIPLIKYRFTDNTFKRNNWKVSIAHVSIGWKGCWLVGANAIAYLGVSKPLVIGILPPRLRYFAYHWLKKFDPRAKDGGERGWG